MSGEIVQQIKERMRMDRVFRNELFASPLHVLQEDPLLNLNVMLPGS